MRTFDAHVRVEIDAATVGEMLEELQKFTNAIVSSEHVRVTGMQYDGPKDEVRLELDIRKPGWKNYVKSGGKP